MALTFVEVAGAESVSGKIRERFYDVTFDSSYPTGGEAVSPSDVGMLQIYGAVPVGVGGNKSAAGYEFKWDTLLNKILVFWSGTAGAVEDQVANATNLSAVVTRFRFMGI